MKIYGDGEIRIGMLECDTYWGKVFTFKGDKEEILFCLGEASIRMNEVAERLDWDGFREAKEEWLKRLIEEARLYLNLIVALYKNQDWYVSLKPLNTEWIKKFSDMAESMSLNNIYYGAVKDFWNALTYAERSNEGNK